MKLRNLKTLMLLGLVLGLAMWFASCGGGSAAIDPGDQNQQPATTNITGRLLQGGGDRILSQAGAGLPDVLVSLISTATGNLYGSDLTDGAGNFEFRSVPNGSSYLVKVEFQSSQDLDGDGQPDRIELYFPMDLLDEASISLIQSIGVSDSDSDGSVDSVDVNTEIFDDDGNHESHHQEINHRSGKTRIDEDNDGDFEDEDEINDSDHDGIGDFEDEDDHDNGGGSGSGAFDTNHNTTGFGIPGGLTGNIAAGQAVWDSNGCAGCHSGGMNNEDFEEFAEAIAEVPAMAGFNLTDQELADLTAWSNRSQDPTWDGGGSNDGGTDGGGSGGGNFDENGNTAQFGIPAGLTGNITAGEGVWNSNSCSTCHGVKNDRTFQQIQGAFNIPAMSGFNLSDQQIADLTAYSNRNNPGGGATGGNGGVDGGGNSGGGDGGTDDDDDDDDD